LRIRAGFNRTKYVDDAPAQERNTLERKLHSANRSRQTLDRARNDECSSPALDREPSRSRGALERPRAKVILIEPAPLHPFLRDEHVGMEDVRLDHDPDGSGSK
jgi:hypothetical protein